MPSAEVIARAAERRERVRELAADGLDRREIATELGVTPERVRQILQEQNGAKPRARPPRPPKPSRNALKVEVDRREAGAKLARTLLRPPEPASSSAEPIVSQMFGQALRERWQASGLSQAAFARSIGLSRYQLERRLKANRPPLTDGRDAKGRLLPGRPPLAGLQRGEVSPIKGTSRLTHEMADKILDAIATGRTITEIAAELEMSPLTLAEYLYSSRAGSEQVQYLREHAPVAREAAADYIAGQLQKLALALMEGPSITLADSSRFRELVAWGKWRCSTLSPRRYSRSGLEMGDQGAPQLNVGVAIYLPERQADDDDD